MVSAGIEPLSDPTGSSEAQITPQLLLPLTEAKGPFVSLHHFVIGYGPPPMAGTLQNFSGNSRLGNSPFGQGQFSKERDICKALTPSIWSYGSLV